MMLYTEIWRAALFMVKCYGPEASALAAIQAAQHFVRGDPYTMAVWQRVVDAIIVLESNQIADGETIH